MITSKLSSEFATRLAKRTSGHNVNSPDWADPLYQNEMVAYCDKCESSIYTYHIEKEDCSYWSSWRRDDSFGSDTCRGISIGDYLNELRSI